MKADCYKNKKTGSLSTKITQYDEKVQKFRTVKTSSTIMFYRQKGSSFSDLIHELTKKKVKSRCYVAAKCGSSLGLSIKTF